VPDEFVVDADVDVCHENLLWVRDTRQSY